MSHDILNLETCFCHTAYIFGKSHEPLRAMIVGGRSLAWHMEDLAALLGPDEAKDWHFFLDGFMIMQLRKSQGCGTAHLLFSTR